MFKFNSSIEIDKMKKGKIINFELLWDIKEDPWPILFEIVSKDIIQAANSGYNTIIGILLVEGMRPYDKPEFLDFMRKIEIIGNSVGIEEIILISGYQYSFKNIVFPYKYFAWESNIALSYNAYENLLENLPRYNHTNNKFLFLTGIATRPNRIGLLSKFYDNDLIKNSIWSFFYPVSLDDQLWCRNYLNHYDDSKFNKFIEDCKRSIDDIYTEYNKFQRDDFENQSDIKWIDIRHTQFCKNEIYMDPSVFSKTAFSIISESKNYWSNEYSFVTEKTWRTILHRHPFIFAGHPDQFRYLKSIGIRTFENYMKIQDYAYIEDEELRLDAIVENTKDFLINHSKYSEDIQRDVEHNFSLFLQKAIDNNKQLKTFLESYGVDQEDMEYNFFTITGFDRFIRVPNE